MAKKQEQNQEQKQEQKQSKPLYTVRKWAKTEKGTGVMLRMSAKIGEDWSNINAYVPTEINVIEDRAGIDAFARIKTNEKTGKKYAVVFIPIEDEYKPKLEASAKPSETLEEGGIPF